jgi:hypothetical protein
MYRYGIVVLVSLRFFRRLGLVSQGADFTTLAMNTALASCRMLPWATEPKDFLKRPPKSQLQCLL